VCEATCAGCATGGCLVGQFCGQFWVVLTGIVHHRKLDCGKIDGGTVENVIGSLKTRRMGHENIQRVLTGLIIEN